MRKRLVLFAISITVFALSAEPVVRAADTGSIVSFRAAPKHVRAGEPVTLEWQTRGIASVSLDWAPADDPRGRWEHRAGLPASGSLVVKPAVNTIYVLTCETPSGGSACASASVRIVTGP